MKHIYTIIILLTGLAITSCEKDEDDNNNESTPTPSVCDIEISTGQICGWCAGADTLILTEETIDHTYSAVCEVSIINNSSDMQEDLWNEITTLLDTTTFKTIDVNSCNYCADGCDTWISVKSSDFEHHIRFGESDATTIEPIMAFITKIDSIRQSYRD